MYSAKVSPQKPVTSKNANNIEPPSSTADECDDDDEKNSYELSFEEEEFDVVDDNDGDDDTDTKADERELENAAAADGDDDSEDADSGSSTVSGEQLRAAFQQVSYVTKEREITTHITATTISAHMVDRKLSTIADSGAGGDSLLPADETAGNGQAALAADRKRWAEASARETTRSNSIVSDSDDGAEEAEDEEEVGDEYNEYMDLSFLESSDADEAKSVHRSSYSTTAAGDDEKQQHATAATCPNSMHVKAGDMPPSLLRQSDQQSNCSFATSETKRSQNDDTSSGGEDETDHHPKPRPIANRVTSSSPATTTREQANRDAVIVRQRAAAAAIARSSKTDRTSVGRRPRSSTSKNADDNVAQHVIRSTTTDPSQITDDVPSLVANTKHSRVVAGSVEMLADEKPPLDDCPDATDSADEYDAQIECTSAPLPKIIMSHISPPVVAQPIALTAKTSVRQQHMVQKTNDQTDAVSAASSSVTTSATAKSEKSAVPLHAVKSRRVSRPGAPDSAQSSRATTASSRTAKTVGSVASTDDSGGDVYRHFRKLQNQYKSLQTRIQLGMKHLHTQVPEEIDELDLYARGLSDKRERDRAQRLTLLEKLKVALAQATSAVERLQTAPHDARAKEAAKSTLTALSQELASAREMYRSIDVMLNEQAKTSTHELRQCQDRLGTYAKRLASDIDQQQMTPKTVVAKSVDVKEGCSTVSKKTAVKDGLAPRRRSQPPLIASSKTLLSLTAEPEHVVATTNAVASSKIIPDSIKTTTIAVTMQSLSAAKNADELVSGDEAATKNLTAPVVGGGKSRIQTRLTTADLPEAVFEYRNFIEQNGGRNGRGWTELEHKAFLSMRTKHRAFAGVGTAGDDDDVADELAAAAPINDERFYAELASELMIKTAQQVREHDEWYSQLQRLNLAQKAVVKVKKDAKQAQREQKQRALKEQQARQRLLAQKHREQALRKWHEQTREQVEQWKAKKTLLDKQKQDEQKFAQLVQKERQMKLRQQHDQMKQKVLLYRQQREQALEAERAARAQQEAEVRRQRALEANRFLKLSANKSIQNVQQQRQRSKTFVEQRKIEHEERLNRLRRQVSVKVERDPQRVLEKTTAWKRRTGEEGVAADEDGGDAKSSRVAERNKKQAAATASGGGGDAASAASSSSDEDDDDDDDDESDEEEKVAQKGKKAEPVVASPRRKANKKAAAAVVVVRKQHQIHASSPQKKPFVAGGFVKKPVVMKL